VKHRQLFCSLPRALELVGLRSLALIRYFLAFCALVAACYSFLLARAQWLFQRDTASSVPAAVRLVPYNSEYLARLAAWRQPEKLPLLHRAIALNPFDFESLIQIGFVEEFQKRDLASAERYYLKAADVNKMFLPKWTLTNFYFRHERSDEFFHWAMATLAITPYSPDPVFTQMWLMSQDAANIARAIPNRLRTLLAYAWFLSNNHQYAAIPSVVQRLISAVGKGDPHAWGRDDLLAAIEDRLIAAGDRNGSLSVWANMARAGWLQQSVPSGDHPITNEHFMLPFFQHGFDWIPAEVDGIRIEQFPSEGLLRIQFSGDEPQRAILLCQFVPLDANRTYDLRWRVESRLPDLPSGLTWHLQPVDGVGGPDLFSDDLVQTSQQGWQFRAPSGTELYRLSLEYARPLGHPRATGAVVIRGVSANLE
jgi:tetratricopeptide (TPR) repeat protein